MKRSEPTLQPNIGQKAIIFICFFIPLFFAVSIQIQAQGNLLVTPRRVVFDSKKKIQELNLANTGKDTARYVISIIDIRMKEDGSFEQITEPDSGQLFAGKQLRIFPRSVVLAPNEAQVIKVQVTKSEQLEPGEYRSHIYFRAVPSKKPLGEEEAADNSKEIAVRLTPVFGISIPVIIRSGASDTKVNISDISLETIDQEAPKLNLKFNRTGNMSVYGDLTVNFIPPKGKTKQVASIKGIAIYTPNTARNLHVDLDKTSGIDYRSGKFQIVYKNQKDAGSDILADAAFEPQRENNQAPRSSN
jgi:P pilus assembly chaperone PapD